MTTQSRTIISSVSLMAILTFLAGSADAWAPTRSIAFTAQQHSCQQATTTTQLSAWSLPAPMQKNGGSYWYQDCGSAIDRHIVYNDEDDYFDWQNDDGFGQQRAFARLNYLQDLEGDELRVSFPQDQQEQRDNNNNNNNNKGRSPLRAVKGIWNRIRHN